MRVMYRKSLRSILSLAVLLVFLLGLFMTACDKEAEPTPTTILMSTVTPTPEPSLTWDVLHNADYPSEFPRGKIARLSNGVYEEEYVPGAATKLVIRMADFGAFGLLDQDEAIDAAVILISDPGGSGTFIHMVAALDPAGKPHLLRPALLGDRIAVRAVRIEDHKITLRMRVRGPTDPFVKLTREVTRTYSLAGEDLVLESETTEDVP